MFINLYSFYATWLPCLRRVWIKSNFKRCDGVQKDVLDGYQITEQYCALPRSRLPEENGEVVQCCY